MFELDELELFEEDSKVEEILDELELELEELEFELELGLELEELELELLDELELELELLDELELELEELELGLELDSDEDTSLEDELFEKLQPVKQIIEINDKVKSFTIFLCAIKSLPCINILLKK